ncbi:RidA family protein [Lactococcus taiwanensis]|uniref:RidA family protein n=1 Tax=Lactococcus taiwanensis TaxID=1151742 RepID=UPI0023F07675|nr:RidA family protein [Lactococcus taiwanensis]
MTEIQHHEINEEWAQSGVVIAGDFVFTSYCVGDNKEDIEGQINGAFDYLCEKLARCNIRLENVVKIDALFRNIQDIPVLEKVIKERFTNNFPARKSFQTEFCEQEQLFQLDAIAYRK